MKRVLTILITLLTLISCKKEEIDYLKGQFKQRVIDENIYTKAVSLQKAGETIYFLYSDETTVTIKKASLKGDTVEANYIDSIDTDSRINPTFSKSYLSITEEEEELFYYDFQSEKVSVFKHLTRKGDTKEYTIDTLDINCTLYDIFFKEYYYFLYYNESLGLSLLKDGELENYEIKGYKNGKIERFTILSIDDDKINIVLLNDKMELYNTVLKLDSSTTTAEVRYNSKIDDEVKLYDFKTDSNRLEGLYYKKDYSLNYYRGVAEKVGYFPSIIELHLLYNRERPLFILSEYDRNESKEQYLLSAIFQTPPYDKKRDSWKKEVLMESDQPLYSINSLAEPEGFHITIGGHVLYLLSFEASLLDEKVEE